MLRQIPFLLLLILIASCKKEEVFFEGRTELEIAVLCQTPWEFAAPSSLSSNLLTELDFPGYLREFDFVSENTGYALGSLSRGGYPVVLRTDDGGLSWEDTGLVGDESSRGFDFFDENFGIVSTYSREQSVLRQRRLLPLIWITRDGGDTWEKQFINDRVLDGRAGTVLFDSQGIAYLTIYQEDGVIMTKSEDQGISWSRLFELPSQPGGIQIVDDEFYFGPVDERVIRIDLSGEILGEIILPANSYRRAIEILDENNVYIITDSLYRTADGGRTWAGLAEGRGRILGFAGPEQGLVMMNVDFCPTDVGPSIDVLRSITSGDNVNTGPQVANLANSIQAGHLFVDGTALISFRNQIFKLE